LQNQGISTKQVLDILKAFELVYPKSDPVRLEMSELTIEDIKAGLVNGMLYYVADQEAPPSLYSMPVVVNPKVPRGRFKVIVERGLTFSLE
jgi:hypothetical protein